MRGWKCVTYVVLSTPASAQSVCDSILPLVKCALLAVSAT